MDGKTWLSDYKTAQYWNFNAFSRFRYFSLIYTSSFPLAVMAWGERFENAAVISVPLTTNMISNRFSKIIKYKKILKTVHLTARKIPLTSME